MWRPVCILCSKSSFWPPPHPQTIASSEHRSPTTTTPWILDSAFIMCFVEFRNDCRRPGIRSDFALQPNLLTNFSFHRLSVVGYYYSGRWPENMTSFHSHVPQTMGPAGQGHNSAGRRRRGDGECASPICFSGCLWLILSGFGWAGCPGSAYLGSRW